MIMHKVILFFILLNILSCTTSSKLDLTFYPKKKITKPEKLDLESIEKDISYLTYALRNAYSGYFYKNKLSIDKGINSLQTSLLSIKTINPSSLCELMASSFRNVRDMHLTFKLGAHRCFEVDELGRVGDRKYSSDNKVYTVKVERHKKYKVLVIAISHFDSPSSIVWDGMLESINKNVNNVDVVVLDVRGNGGGDDAMGYQLAKALTGESNIVTPYGNLYKVVTMAGLQSRWNLFSHLSYNAHSSEEERFFKSYIEKDKELFINSKNKTEILDKNIKPIRFSKAIRPTFILQDKGCGSSCESSIDFFEYIKGVLKVGENTAGYVHFGNLGFVLLPESTIQVNIPSTFNSYRDGRFIEGIGIKPDIKVEKGDDAYKKALNHFENKISL